MKRKNLVMVFVFGLAMMLIASGLASAETNSSDDTADDNTEKARAQSLTVRYDHLKCKVDFTVAQADILDDYVNDTNLSATVDALETHLAELKSFVDAENMTAFDSYMEDTVRPDFVKATSELNRIKSDFRSYSLDNETRNDIKEGLKDAKDKYSDCISDKEEKMARLVLKHMEQWKDKQAKIVEKMQKKGYNTTEIEAVEAEFEQRLGALKASIENGNTSELRGNLMKVSKASNNIWVRHEKAKLDSYIDRMEPIAAQHGKSEKVRAMKDKLRDLESADETEKYSAQDAKEARKIMKETTKELQQTSKDILGAQKESMKQQKEQEKEQAKASKDSKDSRRP